MSPVAPVTPDQSPKLPPAVELDQVRFRYAGGPDILHIPSLLIERHERVFLYGPSGSGKTTLLAEWDHRCARGARLRRGQRRSPYGEFSVALAHDVLYPTLNERTDHTPGPLSRW